MSNHDTLLLFYLGIGFSIFLLYMAFTHDGIHGHTPLSMRIRYDRWARILAVVGVLHPGFALCGLDLARQLMRLDEPPTARAQTTLRRARWGTRASFAVGAVASVTYLAVSPQ
ncbi:MAG TPA: hypothetical protein VHC63_00975 [Acidimicrobiales bacterium]|nr:hypothetical protein [Acidimicrobiales bacterium]